jgi:hypothetical protein
MSRLARYSLRTAFLLVSVAAVVCWYWWRRPFEMEVVITAPNAGPPLVDLGNWEPETGDPFEVNPHLDPFGPKAHLRGYYRREVRTVRRNGFRGVVRDGPTTAYTKLGKKVFEENWRGGRRHGRYTMWTAGGETLVEGQFRGGEKDGRWRFRNSAGDLLLQQEFARARPHGTWVQYVRTGDAVRKSRETTYENGTPTRDVWYRYLEDGSREVHSADYEEGAPVRVDGMPINEFTSRFKAAPQWLRASLDRQAFFESDAASLDAIVPQLQDGGLLGVPVWVGPSARSQLNVAVTHDLATLQGLPLPIVLPLLLRDHDLVCDYRFDHVVITTRSDAETWEDRTGVDALMPSPGSELANRLKTETGAEIRTASQLKEAFGDALMFAPDVPCTEARTSEGAIIHGPHMPRRYWLHLYLGHEGLHCDLDGDTLIVSPQTEP